MSVSGAPLATVLLLATPALISCLAEYEPPFGERLKPRPFKYQYGVEGEQQTPSFSKKEIQDEEGNVLGEVIVSLPDGRVQTTNYNADFYDGYLADVKYTGEAHYPPSPPSSHEGHKFIPVHLKQRPAPQSVQPLSHQLQSHVQPHVQSHVQPHVQPQHFLPRVQSPVQPHILGHAQLAQSHAQHVQSHIQHVQPHVQPHIQTHVRPHVKSHVRPHVRPHVQHRVPVPHPVHRPLHNVHHDNRVSNRPRPVHTSPAAPLFTNFPRTPYQDVPEFKEADIELPSDPLPPQEVEFESTKLAPVEDLPSPVTLPAVTPPLTSGRLVLEDRDQFEEENEGFQNDFFTSPFESDTTQREPSEAEVQTEALRFQMEDFNKILSVEEATETTGEEDKEAEEYQILAEIVKTSDKLVQKPEIMSIKSHLISSLEETTEPFMSIKSHVIDSSEDAPLMSIKSHVLDSSEDSTLPVMSIKSHLISSPEVTTEPIMSIKSHLIDHLDESTLPHVIEETAPPVELIKTQESSEETTLPDQPNKKPLKKSIIDFMKKVEENKKSKDTDIMSVKSRVIQHSSQDNDGNEMMKISSRIIPRNPKSLENEDIPQSLEDEGSRK